VRARLGGMDTVSDMRFLSAPPPYDLTYSDVFLAPVRSGVSSRLDVSLVPDDGTGATLPIVAANMNSVTGPRLAATLARRGGLAVLPQDLPPEELAEAIAWVKAQSTRWDSPIVLSPKSTVWDAQRLVTGGDDRGVVVVDKDEVVLGVVTAAALGKAEAGTRLGELLVPEFGTLSVDAPGPEEIFGFWDDMFGSELVAVTDGERLVGTASKRSLVRQAVYTPALDAQGRLRVAAALGINGDVAGRAKRLVELGADVLVLDTAHGHQEGMLRALETVAALDLGLPLVAGNVVTAEATRDLVRAGASIVKVGVGPGAMCTTRMMTAVGRPQFSAVLETADAAHQLGAHVWADGGVRYPRDVALALAAGASSVMIGSWFAGTIEAPGVLEHGEDGALFKQSWGMASSKAVSARFGNRDPWELARKQLFAEGISSSRIVLDPLRPGLEDLLDTITTGVRSSFTYAGAADPIAFRERATVGVQSAAGYEEGKPLPIGW
jgi:IMP dehydrogenase